MKFVYAAVLALAPITAGASTITLDGDDLVATETTVAGSWGYAVDLFALGFKQVFSVKIVDGLELLEKGGATTGFDFDAMGIGPSEDAISIASEYLFTPGGANTGTTLVGALPGNTGIRESFVTPGVFDGTSVPKTGFLSLGRSGSLEAIFGSGVVTDENNRFLFIREVGAEREVLASISIDGVVPLPASALLLMTGIAGMVVQGRRRRKST